MPLLEGLRKVMVIGSGPIIIGQAAEFDYAGTQACRVLKEAGLEVVLLNSNPATIMTDADVSDHCYIEPITVSTMRKILAEEKPDGIIATLGGQVGLNLALAMEREGLLEKSGVPLLGTPLAAIARAEDRELFKQAMQDIGEPVPPSAIVHSVDEALLFAGKTGYPVIVRPAYTLGGTGGGSAADEGELRGTASRGLMNSPISQVLIERSVAGYKEIEFEVMRDAGDNCIAVCSMENFDPVGIHTGDSIVVAPAQTLNDSEYQMLRSAAIKIIRSLEICGGCNVQFALDPASKDYYVIEVNPRVSRSSALASKATGYPIAKVAALIAIGYRLDEIPNAVTGKTTACFEPALDYVVLKTPRWPFDKFAQGDRSLGTQMKATGEVMAIDRSFEAALQKSIRCLEIGMYGLRMPELEALEREELMSRLQKADDERVFIIYEAFRRGFGIDEIASLSRIDRYFLFRIKLLATFEIRLRNEELAPDLLRTAKQMGFSDAEIGVLQGRSAVEIFEMRSRWNIRPSYKLVDTCAAEFEAATPYFYSCYEEENEALSENGGEKILVIGSGPIRIGQGVEFDYCSVHCVWALRAAGIKAIIVNNNPETVSTDFDTSDRLYFEPLVLEDVLNIIEQEKPEAVVVQFGGQTAINLAGPLAAMGVRILGTSTASIDMAEDRDKFDALLEKLGIPRPQGASVFTVEEALQAAERIGYPVLVRPSYVLGGRAMEIVYTGDELRHYMANAAQLNPEHPVLVDKYLQGREIEVDAVSDGDMVVIPGIMQHIERAGVHSGDSIAVFPAHDITPGIEAKVASYTRKLARGLNIRGLINIQFVEYENQLYVLEVNPRSSRTVPFVSKITGINLVRLATEIMLGRTLKEMGYRDGIQPRIPYYAVKVPVFSFGKLLSVDTTLGPEMKSTGEVMGIDTLLDTALYKGLVAAGLHIPHRGNIAATIADKDKPEAIKLIREFALMGFKLVATEGTAWALRDSGLESELVWKMSEGSPNIADLIREGQVNLVVNTLTNGRTPFSDGFQIRRTAAEFNVPCLTSLDTLTVMMEVVAEADLNEQKPVKSLQVYEQLHRERRANRGGEVPEILST